MSAGLSGQNGCLKELWPGHSDNKITHHLTKNIYTASSRGKENR